MVPEPFRDLVVNDDLLPSDIKNLKDLLEVTQGEWERFVAKIMAIIAIDLGFQPQFKVNTTDIGSFTKDIAKNNNVFESFLNRLEPRWIIGLFSIVEEAVREYSQIIDVALWLEAKERKIPIVSLDPAINSLSETRITMLRPWAIAEIKKYFLQDKDSYYDQERKIAKAYCKDPIPLTGLEPLKPNTEIQCVKAKQSAKQRVEAMRMANWEPTVLKAVGKGAAFFTVGIAHMVANPCVERTLRSVLDGAGFKVSPVSKEECSSMQYPSSSSERLSR